MREFEERESEGSERHELISRGFASGVEFALRSFKAVLPFAALVILVKGTARVLSLRPALSFGEQFLAVVFAQIADVWLFVALAMFALNSLRGGSLTARTIAGRAFLLLPKTLLSFVAFVLILAGAMSIPILLPLGLLAFWAPFFVVGELFAPERSNREEEDFSVDDGEEPQLFTGQGLLDWGLLRSFRFGLQYFQFTVQSFVLIWAAEMLVGVLSLLFVSALKVEDYGTVSITLSCLVRVVILTAIILAFFRAIPREAASELSLRPDHFAVLQPRPALQWIPGALRRWALTILLTVACLLSTLYFVKELQAGRFSDGLTTSSEGSATSLGTHESS